MAVATLAYAVVVAQLVTAAWSLVAGEPWDWGRFWLFMVVVSLSGVASNLAQRLVHRTSTQAQRKAAEDDEVADAMRTGVIPPVADSTWWRARIRAEIRLVVGVVASGAVLSVTAAVLTFVAAYVTSDDDPILWVLAIVTLLLLAPLSWMLVRGRRRGRRLLARL